MRNCSPSADCALCVYWAKRRAAVYWASNRCSSQLHLTAEERPVSIQLHAKGTSICSLPCVHSPDQEINQQSDHTANQVKSHIDPGEMTTRYPHFRCFVNQSPHCCDRHTCPAPAFRCKQTEHQKQENVRSAPKHRFIHTRRPRQPTAFCSGLLTRCVR